MYNVNFETEHKVIDVEKIMYFFFLVEHFP